MIVNGFEISKTLNYSHLFSYSTSTSKNLHKLLLTAHPLRLAVARQGVPVVQWWHGQAFIRIIFTFEREYCAFYVRSFLILNMLLVVYRLVWTRAPKSLTQG